MLGDIQEARGDNLAAVQSYQAAVTLAPNEEKYRLSLAVELIRHNSFEAAKAVLKQAEELQPKSWRIQLALGMVEYFAGTDEEATRFLLRAAEFAPEPQTALKYLGDIQMDRASAPDPAALARLCGYSDRQPKDGHMQFYCGALLFRRDYASGDKTRVEEILKRLRAQPVFFQKTPRRIASWAELIDGWSAGRKRLANQKSARAWTRTPRTRTTAWLRFIDTWDRRSSGRRK